MKRHFDDQKMERQIRYERLCRTPGTPEHAARQERLDQRTRQLQREQDEARRKVREENAARALERQRAAIAKLRSASFVKTTQH